MRDIIVIDRGSSYNAVLRYSCGTQEKVFYGPHKGRWEDTGMGDTSGITVYQTGINSLDSGGFHPCFVLMELARERTGIRHVIYVGAGSYFIINLGHDGRYINHLSNTTCASGTGSFLDLQAHRLGYATDELGIAARQARVRPSISTRCSVFAKTDLIHLQQEGYTRQEIAAGLCRSMAVNIIDALLKGVQPSGNVMLCGGVFRNEEVLESFRERLGRDRIVCDAPEFSLAEGLIVLARKGIMPGTAADFLEHLTDSGKLTRTADRVSRKTDDYPDFHAFKTDTDDDGNEIVFYRDPPEGETPVWMGIDIGSTSTKVCLIDSRSHPVLSVYRATSSDPVRAVKLVFTALQRIERANGASFSFLGVATTGSGRKMIGDVTGADYAINEISAHAKAAVFIDPRVDTIIEIGGQDSKFTRLRDGAVYYSKMNYVCAAGTGSFIEEQAEKLGVRVRDFSSMAEGMTPPLTSDRCTVFMEKDIDLLMARGIPPAEIAAAVLISVRDNYLNKVVGNVPVGDHVYFQGATARNRALVAVFEQRLGRTIIVSPFCHVTGALGAALDAEARKPVRSRFKGLGFADAETRIDKEECRLCINACALSLIRTGESTVAWGMKCGRDYADHAPKKKQVDAFALHRSRCLARDSGNSFSNGVIHLPDVLANSGKTVFLDSLFKALDIEPRWESPRKDDLERGRRNAQFEICAPCVATFGLISRMKDAAVFMPHFLGKGAGKAGGGCHLCPLTQAAPSILTTMFSTVKLIAPRLPENMDADEQAEQVYLSLKNLYPVSRNAVRDACSIARIRQDEDDEVRFAMGDRFLAELGQDRMGALVLARPYILNNRTINHGIADLLEEHGMALLPVDFLRPDADFTGAKFPHVYWAYGRRILSGLKTVRDRKNLFPVYLTCFSCGPDSFILNYFHREMTALRKPSLTLQFDGHSASTGYVTRLEAAVENFRKYGETGGPAELSGNAYSQPGITVDKRKKVFIPPIDADGAELFAAVFRRSGFKAEVLRETNRSFRTGLSHSLGHECAPFHSTLGAFMEQVSDTGSRENALFMPSGSGPCRFGQYAILQSIILKEAGISADMLSPSAENAYGGLPITMRMRLFDAIVINDILRQVLLSIRPYEVTQGETDRIYAGEALRIRKAVETGSDYVKAFTGALGKLEEIPVIRQPRPRIGIVGEIYVRNNAFLNDRLIRAIEALGGEAMIASIAEWFFYTLFIERRDARLSGCSGFAKKLGLELKNSFYNRREHFFFTEARKFFPVSEPAITDVVNQGERYLPVEFLGEAILTVGRSLLFIEQEKVDAVVNASPAFCMPGTISGYLLKDVERRSGTPVISLFYDKTGRPNLELLPYMQLLAAGKSRQ